MADNEKPEIKEKPIRLVWGSPEELPALYANHIQVSHAGGTEFHIVFGHAAPPLTVGLLEDELPDKVVIKPVSEIVVSPDVMKAFVRVLADNLESFEKNFPKEGKEE